MGDAASPDPDDSLYLCCPTPEEVVTPVEGMTLAACSRCSISVCVAPSSGKVLADGGHIICFACAMKHGMAEGFDSVMPAKDYHGREAS